MNFLELHTLNLEAAKIMIVNGEWSGVNRFLWPLIHDFSQPLAIGQLFETDSLFGLNILLIQEDGHKTYQF